MGDGGPLTDAGDVISHGLDFLGLHGAADAVDGASDGLVDGLGGVVGERSLDDTGDPRLLVHGDPAAIGTSSAHLRRFADAFERTADGLRALDVGQWSGVAGDAFRSAFSPQPQAWFAAADACTRAAESLDGFATVVVWAQGRAAEAARLHRAGAAATDRAQTAYANQLSAYHVATTGYRLGRMVGVGTGQAPIPPVDPGDPGLADRRLAQEVLDRARAQRDAAAAAAQQAVSAATATAPPPPAAGDRIAADLTAEASVAQTQAQHVTGGLVKGTAAMVAFVRQLDPVDPYNVSRPARYLDTVSTTVAGLSHAVANPIELVTGLLGTQWGSDPGEALGRLAANVTADVATGGAVLTAAARVAARRAEHTAVTGSVRSTRTASEVPTQPLAKVDAQTAAEFETREASLDRIRETLDGPRPDATVPVPHHTTPPPDPVHAIPTPPRVDVAPVVDTATDTSAITRALDGPPRPAPATPPASHAATPAGRTREGSWTRLARTTPNVRRPSIHDGSATPAEANAYVRHEHPQLPGTNRSRYLTAGGIGYKQNCTHCVATVEEQLNGKWTQAAARPLIGNSLADLLKRLPPARQYPCRSYNSLVQRMDALGPGTRGFVLITRPDTSAHVFNVITTRDGIVFLDGQNGRLATLEKNVTGIFLYVYKKP